MAESVPVRCPACRREHSFTPPTFPCPCGAPVTLPVLRGGVPLPLQRRTWEDSWVRVRCGSCGREDQWPRPELGCACGTVLLVPVASAAVPASGTAGDIRATPVAGLESTERIQPPSAVVLRPAFRPVTIRTSRDAINAAAQYMKWLGYKDVRIADETGGFGVDLCGPGVVAQVDPTTRPTTLRDVECLWLHSLTQAAASVFFSLAGYTRDARTRADELRIPLFVMDLTGTPQPVNDAADDLIDWGP